MRIFVCKLFEEKNAEQKIAKLISKERKRANDLRLFCIDERIRERLESTGLPCKLLDDLCDEFTDEPSWERAFELSDRWRVSAENNDALNFYGTNFLECPVDYQVFVVKFAKLCQRLADQGCEVVVVVLNKYWNGRFPSINSTRMKTIVYGGAFKQGLARYALFGLKAFINRFKNQSRPSLNKRPKHIKLKDKGQKRALFVVSTYGPNINLYATPALAVIDKCPSDGITPSVVVDNNRLVPIFRSKGVECTSIPTLPLSSIGKYFLLLYRLRKHVNALKADDGQEGFSAEFLSKRMLFDTLPLLCYQALTGISFFRRQFEVNPPDMICTIPDSSPEQRMAVAVARKHDIPSITIQAANIFDHAAFGVKYLAADMAAVMGETTRSYYLKRGISSERVVVTGLAHFDHIFRRNGERDREVLSRYEIDPSKRIIVFTTQHISITVTLEIIRGIMDAVLKLKDSLLVIKVHPREEIQPYQRMVEDYGDSRIHVVKDIDLYALLNNCQLLVTGFSTTAVEAMMFDKPVIAVNLSEQPEFLTYATEGAALGVYKYQDIEPAINKALFDEETRNELKQRRDKFVYNYAYKTDGKASHRIVELMKEHL